MYVNLAFNLIWSTRVVRKNGLYVNRAFLNWLLPVYNRHFWTVQHLMNLSSKQSNYRTCHSPITPSLPPRISLSLFSAIYLLLFDYSDSLILFIVFYSLPLWILRLLFFFFLQLCFFHPFCIPNSCFPFVFLTVHKHISNTLLCFCRFPFSLCDVLGCSLSFACT